MAKNRGVYIKISIFAIDIICLMLCFILATHIWSGGYSRNALTLDNYNILLIAYMIIFIFFNTSAQFLKRSSIEEFLNIIKITVILGVMVLVLLYFMKISSDFSRGVFSVTLCLFVVADYAVRIIVKRYLEKTRQTWINKLILITTYDKAPEIIKRLNDGIDVNMAVDRVIILDKNCIGEKISKIPVVAGKDDLLTYIRKDVVGDVMLYVQDPNQNWVAQIVKELEAMGITIHINLVMNENLEQFNKRIGILGDYPVISVATNFFDADKMMIKRIMDIIGGLIGCLIAIIIGIILAPFLLIESPGPLLFKQKRVGLNGEYFYIYKFRSMYMDAEERKKELMKKNEMKGLMFKIKEDPRITKVGKFIRATSLDEFPQFFNVLKGNMSMVGTRPPTIDEFKQYEGYHKRRLSIKPGITGMWQVSGRSDIEDFEEVVRLDLKYIDNWSLSLDIKILLKTMVTVFWRSGAR